jgi:tetraacyldisaccharide 4'-kinase
MPIKSDLKKAPISQFILIHSAEQSTINQFISRRFSMHPLGNNIAALFLSSIYGRIIAARNRHFDLKGGLHTSFPVISVGGIHAGGTGKTPMAMFIGTELRELGKTAAFLSRGYKRKTKKAIILPPGAKASWQDIGDEPAMIRSDQPDSWLGIGPNRYANALSITRHLKSGSSVFILDDGFQHRKIHRNLDIVCLPPSFFKDSLIPAGYLREPVSSLARANVLCVIGQTNEADIIEESRLRLKQLFPNALCISAHQTSCGWFHMASGKYASALPLKNPALVCGIARPQRFINLVKNTGVSLSTVKTFEDHHVFTENDLKGLLKKGGDGIITTWKDACRLNTIKNLVYDTNLWYLKVQMELCSTEMKRNFITVLKKHIRLL